MDNTDEKPSPEFEPRKDKDGYFKTDIVEFRRNPGFWTGLSATTPVAVYGEDGVRRMVLSAPVVDTISAELVRDALDEVNVVMPVTSVPALGALANLVGWEEKIRHG